MSLFSAVWARLLPSSRGESLQYPPTSVARAPIVRGSCALWASQQEWDSTESAAQAVSRAALHRELQPAERICGAIAMHFVVSAGAGAIYGLTAELLPQATAGFGGAFGAGLWTVAQEIAMPLLRWSRPLPQYPLLMQLNSLGEHVAYGMTTEIVRGAARKAL